MKEMFRMGLAHSINEDGALEQFTPIELPSDEDIIKDSKYKSLVGLIWIEGAKWMRDKIKGEK